MKPLRLFLATACAVSAVALCLVATTACETESAGGNSVSVSPSEATIGIDQSITLKAFGGETYVWSLATPEIGRLSTTSGSTTTYTAISGLGSNQVVTVVATTGTGSSSSGYGGTSYDSTNSTSSASSSSANMTVVIRHR